MFGHKDEDQQPVQQPDANNGMPQQPPMSTPMPGEEGNGGEENNPEVPQTPPPAPGEDEDEGAGQPPQQPQNPGGMPGQQ